MIYFRKHPITPTQLEHLLDIFRDQAVKSDPYLEKINLLEDNKLTNQALIFLTLIGKLA